MSKNIVPWMPLGLAEHANDVAKNQTVCGDWHKADVADLRTHFFGLGDELNAALMQEVRPEDLTIGGLAISRLLHDSWRTRQRTIYLGDLTESMPEAVAQIDYWAVDDKMAVQISNSASWNGSRGYGYSTNFNSYTHRLARQARGRLAWIPGIEQKRIDRIAEDISANGILCVRQFKVADNSAADQGDLVAQYRRKDPAEHIYVDDKTASFDDYEIIMEAQLLAYFQYGWDYIWKNKQKGRGLTMKEAAQLAIDSYAVQYNTKLTEDEIIAARDNLVHSKIVELSHNVGVLGRVSRGF